MVQSGANVSQECITAYNELKLNKKYKYIIFKLSDDDKQIVIEDQAVDETTASQRQRMEEGERKGREEQFWETFREKIINAKSKTGAVGEGPRYAVYDLEYKISDTEGYRNKLLFIAWTPEERAPPRAKMTYAASKGALKNALTGIAHELQANYDDDIEYETILKSVNRGLP
ncbi:cofilin [Niveomyces insectorum RCEF 264]|uniref:Cofilin n=1 Tax=Niveomyces insectorum RCEF 264 TaxID=1081102 RepID=A0A167X187_9HYPO|nr:cofilin [Niveomyces insectorum RCEF 264]